MEPEVHAELDISIPNLPSGKVTLKFDSSRTDYDQLLSDLVFQLKEKYSSEMKLMDVPTKMTCQLHFHRMATGIIKRLKIETYKTAY